MTSSSVGRGGDGRDEGGHHDFTGSADGDDDGSPMDGRVASVRTQIGTFAPRT
jgi:hypothetical protein